MMDVGSEFVQKAVQSYLKDAGMLKTYPMVCDAIIVFSAIRGDSGEQELLTASTTTPYWTIRGMLEDAVDSVLAFNYADEEEEE